MAASDAGTEGETGGPLAPEVVAVDQIGVSSIAVDATNVYWTTSGASGHVASCPKTGCTGAPAILASAQANARHILLTADRVAWLSDDVVRSVPKTGGAIFDSTFGLAPTSFAVIGEVLYLAEANRVRSCANAWTLVCTNASTAQFVASVALGGIVRMGAELLVWTPGVTIRRVDVPVSGYDDVHVESAGVVTAAVDSEIFYATPDGFLRAVPAAGVPDGGAPREVASGLPSPSAIAVGVTDVVIVVENGGQVIRAAKNGASGWQEVRNGLSAPRAVAVDTNAVFVGVAGTGEILRIAR